MEEYNSVRTFEWFGKTRYFHHLKFMDEEEYAALHPEEESAEIVTKAVAESLTDLAESVQGAIGETTTPTIDHFNNIEVLSADSVTIRVDFKVIHSIKEGHLPWNTEDREMSKIFLTEGVRKAFSGIDAINLYENTDKKQLAEVVHSIMMKVAYESPHAPDDPTHYGEAIYIDRMSFPDVFVRSIALRKISEEKVKREQMKMKELDLEIKRVKAEAEAKLLAERRKLEIEKEKQKVQFEKDARALEFKYRLKEIEKKKRDQLGLKGLPGEEGTNQIE